MKVFVWWISFRTMGMLSIFDLFVFSHGFSFECHFLVSKITVQSFTKISGNSLSAFTREISEVLACSCFFFLPEGVEEIWNFSSVINLTGEFRSWQNLHSCPFFLSFEERSSVFTPHLSKPSAFWFLRIDNLVIFLIFPYVLLQLHSKSHPLDFSLWSLIKRKKRDSEFTQFFFVGYIQYFFRRMQLVSCLGLFLITL